MVFNVETGIGHEPFVEPLPYGQAYFNNYAAMGRTTFGIALNSLRVGLVARYLAPHEELVDIGVGDGAFIRARGGETYGYDINPVAHSALINTASWKDATLVDAISSASFWDSLEHIEDPGELVAKVERYCFVSIPVFRDEPHILQSKHYKKEHCWYFTRPGLIRWFWDRGFSCQDMLNVETALGREDIGTFVFKRVI